MAPWITHIIFNYISRVELHTKLQESMGMKSKMLGKELPSL
jgi:hypothetical protein